MSRRTSRREFLAASAAAGAGVWAAGDGRLLAQSSPSSRSPGEKVNVAFIGVGGKGAETLSTMPQTGLMNVVALCDVDERTLGGAAAKHPSAKTYNDYRKLLDDAKGFDAVVVTVPDHHHAFAAIQAMNLGKHVYCEKPLTHSVYEARLMKEVAARNKVATQMGNSGHSSKGTRSLVDAIRAGVIGNVTEAHAWTDRPIWPQGVARPAATPPVPPTLNWDMWLGPAPERPYHPDTYHPFNWRGWWDFGTGALGDMGCHIIDSIYWALELDAPATVEADFDSPHNDETAPIWSIVRYTFNRPGGKSPVKLTWYDGGKLPPEELSEGLVKKDKAGRVQIDNGVLFVGDKGRLLSDRRTGYRLLPEKDFVDFKAPPAVLPVSPGHHQEWLLACKGGTPALGNFDYSGPLTEAVLLGNVAIRTGKKIEWDAANLKSTNVPEAAQFIKRQYRKGWEL
jgi:predicted dehydrogenase